MTSFNAHAHDPRLTTNDEESAAYKLDDRLHLMLAVGACFVHEPKFYGDTTADIEAIAAEVAKTDPAFIAKLAVYARRELMMRSVAQMLVCILADAKAAKGTGLVRAAARGIIRRGDDAPSLIAAWRSYHKTHAVPNGIRRGIADALEQMTPYDIAKYQLKGHDVTMRDCLRIARPEATDPELKRAFEACVGHTLPVPESFNNVRQTGGSREEWERLIAEQKLPYMALLRNLRAMLEAGVDEYLLVNRISDADAVRKSGVLPFRLYTAYRECKTQASSALWRTFNQALTGSIKNLPALSGRTAVLIDTSSSMQQALSARSTVSVAEIASVLGATVCAMADAAYPYAFATTANPLSYLDSPLAFIEGIEHAFNGWSTDIEGAVMRLVDDDIDVDRIIVLTDSQGHSQMRIAQRALDDLRRKLGHDVWMHVWDLAGYGTTQFAGKQVTHLAGFSDTALQFIAGAENGFATQLDAVEHLLLPERGTNIKEPLTYA